MSINHIINHPAAIEVSAREIVPHLNATDTYSFGCTSKAAYAAIRHAATLPQVDLDLEGRDIIICFKDEAEPVKSLLLLKFKNEKFKNYPELFKPLINSDTQSAFNSENENEFEILAFVISDYTTKLLTPKNLISAFKKCPKYSHLISIHPNVQPNVGQIFSSKKIRSYLYKAIVENAPNFFDTLLAHPNMRLKERNCSALLQSAVVWERTDFFTKILALPQTKKMSKDCITDCATYVKRFVEGERHTPEEKEHYQACYDGLCSLPNYSFFDDICTIQ